MIHVYRQMLIMSMENANYILQKGTRHLTKMKIKFNNMFVQYQNNITHIQKMYVTTEELFTSFQNGLGHFKAKLPRFNKLFVTFKVHLF